MFCSLSWASAYDGNSQKHLFKPTLQWEEGHCLGEPGHSLEAQLATSVRKVEDRPVGPDYKLPNQCRKERDQARKHCSLIFQFLWLQRIEPEHSLVHTGCLN